MKTIFLIIGSLAGLLFVFQAFASPEPINGTLCEASLSSACPTPLADHKGAIKCLSCPVGGYLSTKLSKTCQATDWRNITSCSTDDVTYLVTCAPSSSQNAYPTKTKTCTADRCFQWSTSVRRVCCPIYTADWPNITGCPYDRKP